MRKKESVLQTTYRRFATTWHQASRKKRFVIYLGLYTLVFLATFLIAYSPFLLDGKSFIWQNDGRSLYFPNLVYIGRALRRVFLGLTDGELSVPMFDISMSLGDDILGRLGSLESTDPLLLLSAFVPAQFCEYLYDFLTIFRVYLGGLSFSFLCFYFSKKTAHILIGSMVYCFCGYAIYCSMYFPSFVAPMVILPFLIVGLDKILKKEKPYLFIFAMCYAALCGFYHLYMMTIFIVIFALVRFFDLYRNNRVRAFLSAMIRGTAGYLLGIGFASICFLPSIIEFLDGCRSGYVNFNGAYPWTYYTTRLGRLIAPPGSWDDMAFAAIALLAIVLLFFTKGRRTLKILAAVSFAIYLTSIGGLIMNGFQYSSNRWTFALALIAAYAVVDMLPELMRLSRKQQMICIATLVLYTAACFSTAQMRKLNYIPVGAIFLALTVLVLTMTLREPAGKENVVIKAESRRFCSNWREVVCLLLVMANVGVNGVYEFATDRGNYVAAFQQSGYETKRLERVPERELEPFLLQNPDGRGDGTEFSANTGMVWQIPGMLTFSATENRNTVTFWDEVENCGSYQNFTIYSSDQRTIVNTLLSGKYQVEPEKKAAYVPYGYTPVEYTENGRVIYENEYALPWGYTYDRTMSYEELDSLNGLEKQEAMLQAIALEDAPESGRISLTDIAFDERPLPFDMTFKNCEWQDGRLTVSSANATITLHFDMPANVEGYVRLRGLDINDSGLTKFDVSVKCGAVTKRARVMSHLYTWYYGRENYLVNLGYSGEVRDSLTLTFPSKGTFQLKDIELYALPMGNYPAKVEALRDEPMENIQWGTSRFSGTLDLSGDKILCVSVPYSKGWSATVDGEKTKIMRGNYMFMAIPLEAGHHEIEFRYCTPGLKFGGVISLLCVCILAVMLLRDRRRNIA